MISVKEIKFVTVKTETGQYEVKGKLSFEFSRTIIAEELHSYPEIESQAKELIRRAMWNKAYGELIAPLHQLAEEAIKFAPCQHLHRVEQLVGQLNALLERSH